MRPQIPLTSRPDVSLSVSDGGGSSGANPSHGSAVAAVAEADAAQPVAAQSCVRDTEGEAFYSDAVRAEHLRQSRLSRWQEQR